MSLRKATGRESRETRVQVTVPAGINNGSSLRLKEQGGEAGSSASNHFQLRV